MFFDQLNPVFLDLGFLQIRWYGVMYVFAFLTLYLYARSRITSGKAKLTLDQLDSVLLWMTVGMLIGSRLFNAIVWEPTYYASHLWEVFAFWKGGMSFHGGLVGVVVATLVWCKRNKYSFFSLADLMIVPLSLGQAFGRIGNFFNSELYGTITSLPWGVNFNNEVDALGNFVFRHPNQLYEAGYDIIIFAILFAMRDRLPKKEGRLFAWFLVLYAIFRFFTEFLRADEVRMLGLTFGQYFNIVMLVAGGVLLWQLYAKKNSTHIPRVN